VGQLPAHAHRGAGHPGVVRKLVAFAREKKILLCHDNPYSLVLNEEQPISLLSVPGAREVCLELNSMSKSHNMAGWRMGWVSGAKDYIDAVLKVKSNVDSGMFLPVQEAAVAALQNSEAWHAGRNDVYRRRRQLGYRVLDRLGCSYRRDQQGCSCGPGCPTLWLPSKNSWTGCSTGTTFSSPPASSSATAATGSSASRCAPPKTASNKYSGARKRAGD
jgi:aspartate/methionine/tyrosine aminotransferase